MNLREYIETIGDEEAAKVLGVKVRTIKSWRYGARVPRPAKALDIVKKTHGLLTFENIYCQQKKRA